MLHADKWVPYLYFRGVLGSMENYAAGTGTVSVNHLGNHAQIIMEEEGTHHADIVSHRLVHLHILHFGTKSVDHNSRDVSGLQNLFRQQMTDHNYAPQDVTFLNNVMKLCDLVHQYIEPVKRFEILLITLVRGLTYNIYPINNIKQAVRASVGKRIEELPRNPKTNDYEKMALYVLQDVAEKTPEEAMKSK